MIEIPPREFVVAAEKSPSHASGDNMEKPRLVWGRNLAAWIGHAASLAEAGRWQNRKIARHQVRFSPVFLGASDFTLS